jgi:sugar O-acyltransferase (sialic acid O-acetyltransferase NeuD family)
MSGHRRQLGIVGAGGCGREIQWLIEHCGVPAPAAFFESDEVWTARDVAGLPVLPLSRLEPSRWELVLALGDPASRRRLHARLPVDMPYPTFVHPSVPPMKRVEIGVGVTIAAGSILTCDIRVGDQVQLNRATNVGHDCVLGDFVTTAPGVSLSGNCELGAGVYLGTHACVRERVRVAAGACIGMGAVVVGDINDAGTWVGNPARPLRRPDEHR